MKSDMDVPGPKKMIAIRCVGPWMFCVGLSGEDVLFCEHPASLASLKKLSFFCFSESRGKK